jgi:protein-disulfide isomerase
MRGLVTMGLALLIGSASSGCSDEDARSRIDELDKRMERIEKSITRIDGVSNKVDRINREIDRLSDIERRIEGIEKKVLRPEAGLGRRGALGRRGRRFNRPDPAAVYAAPIDGAAFDGRRHAKVTLVESFEFACPFCRRVSSTIAQLKKEYGKDLKVVYKNFIVHASQATIPARAACAANHQGKFMRMHDLIWSKGFDDNRNLSRDNMMRLARQVGLRMSKFRSDMDGPCVERVRQDQAEMSRLGARGTPAFFINGRFLSGARPIGQFRTLIDEELRKANERIRDGTSLKSYYTTWVLEKGRRDL